jgi:alkylation response protein AidB-like acyl-CoA dehydrogenase
VPPGRLLGGGCAQVQRLLDDASVLQSAEALGIMEHVLELTVGYLNLRVQFGRPISSFQAVKHACADLALLVHGSRAATYYAAMSADAGSPEADRAACVAASYTSASVTQVTDTALQLHGGIGFTWEYELHLYLRRAEVDSARYGTAAVHRDRLCTLLQLSPAAS